MRKKGNPRRNLILLLFFISTIILSITLIYNPVITFFSPFSYQQGVIDNEILNNPNIEVIDDGTIQWQTSAEKMNYLRKEPDKFAYSNNLYIDPKGRIWSPTDGRGLFMIENEIIYHWWSGEERGYSDAIRGIAFIKNNLYSIHAGSDTGILGYMNTDTYQWEYPWKGMGNIKGNPYSWGIVADSKNRLYIASDRNYLNILENGKWSNFEMPCRANLPLKVDNNDNLWVYCDAIQKNDNSLQFGEWLVEYSNVNWKKYDIYASKQNGHYATTIEIDPKNRIWMIYKDGILIFEDNSLIKISSDKLPFNGETIYDMIIDNQNRYWFISKTNIAIYNGTDWQLIPSTTYGFDSWYLGASGDNIFAFDKNGILWISSLLGIIKININGQLSKGNIDHIELLLEGETLPTIQ